LPVCILITAKLRTQAPASVLCSATRDPSYMDKSLLQQCFVLQVAPRPVLTNVSLQVPVLAAEASSAQLEADLLKCNLQLNHCRLHLAELVSFHIH